MAVVILLTMALYTALGACFGVAFVWRGVERIDPAASGAPGAFRLLLLPGVTMLWPLLAARWRQAVRGSAKP